MASRLLRLAAALCLGVLIGACADDPTGLSADGPVSVRLAITQGPVVNTQDDGSAQLTCDLTLHATMSGPRKAWWYQATVVLNGGKDGSEELLRGVISRADIIAGWGDSAIAPGATQVSHWTASADVPFSGTIDFLYRPVGMVERSAHVSFECATPVPSNPGPPNVSTVTWTSSDADVEPGDTVTVTYAASVPWGAWRSAAFVDGSCSVGQAFNEGLQTTVTRSATLVLPADCALGTPLLVGAVVIDGVFQEGERLATNRISLVDKTPPSLSVKLYPSNGNSPTTNLSGGYFVGDSIELDLEAADNHALRWIVWEVWPAGLHDSVAVQGARAARHIRIPVPQEWLGHIELRFQARDETGLASATIVSPPGAIRVYPTVARPTASTSIEGIIGAVVIDERRGVAYLSTISAPAIRVLSLSSAQWLPSIALSSVPNDIDLSPSGDSLIVGLPEERALGIVDLRNPGTAPTSILFTGLPYDVPANVIQLRVAANGKVLSRVTVYDFDRLFEVDLRTGVQRIVDEPTPTYLERSHDHSTLVLVPEGCIRLYDGLTGAYEPCRTVSTGGSITMDATGARTTSGLGVYDRSWRLVQRVQSPAEGYAYLSVITPDAREMYYSIGTKGVVRATVEDGQIADRMMLPLNPFRLLVSKDGRWLLGWTSPDRSPTKVSITQLR